jgi:hypothetical protein
MTKVRLLGILFLGALIGQVMAAGWAPQLAQAAVNFINGFAGIFTLGGGTSVNQPWIQVIAPTEPPYNFNNNVITQSTGRQNALRNGSMASWTHSTYMTQGDSGNHPYNIGIASFTGVISGAACAGAPVGTGCLTASSVTGTIQLFQRVTDGVTTTTTGATAVGGTILNLTSVSGLAVGQYVTDTDHPRAIVGNITIASINTGCTAPCVTLNHAVGYVDNTQVMGEPHVYSGDHILFTTVPRGTQIIGTGTAGQNCSECGTGGAGKYVVSNATAVSSETMQAAGGWGPEGLYVIPVGTAGTSNYVTCVATQNLGTWTPLGASCVVTGTLTDLVFRWPLDYVDSSRVNCMLYTGPYLNCGFSALLEQPVTFQFLATYPNNQTSAPTLNSKISCPLIALSAPAPPAANACPDDWTNATYDLSPVTLPACTYAVNSPVQCLWAYTWLPTGIYGNMEIEFHVNAATNGQAFWLQGFELKQTPGATCVGTPIAAGNTVVFNVGAANATIGSTYTNNAVTFTVQTTTGTSGILTTTSSGGSPTATGTLTKASGTGDATITFTSFNAIPCLQLYPGPVEYPEVVQDMHWNQRFAQSIGKGWITDSQGTQLAQTTNGFAISTTHFWASWPLQVTGRCNFWNAAQNLGGSCPVPNIYFPLAAYVGDYKFTTSDGTFAATALAAGKIHPDSLQVDATTSGLTKDIPGYVSWGSKGTVLIDFGAQIGD